METLIGYLKQPTTWAGITAIVTAFGVNISPELAKEITTFGSALAGLLLVIFNEDKKKD